MARRASAIPGATTVRFVCWLEAMALKLFMIPQTVPRSPTKGAAELMDERMMRACSMIEIFLFMEETMARSTDVMRFS